MCALENMRQMPNGCPAAALTSLQLWMTSDGSNDFLPSDLSMYNLNNRLVMVEFGTHGSNFPLLEGDGKSHVILPIPQLLRHMS